MPLLRLMAACGMPHLRNLDEAVGIMKTAMLDVIEVRLWWCVVRVGFCAQSHDESHTCMSDERLFNSVV